MDIPNLGRVRFYVWTTTPDQSVSGRPPGEHKSQIIIPGTRRGERQTFQIGNIPTFILGYSPLFSVFTIWQTELHQNAGYSKNLQIREESLLEGSRSGWAIVRPRRTQQGPEVRAVIHPSHLARFLELSIQADQLNLQAEFRAAYFIAQSADLVEENLTEDVIQGNIQLQEVERRRQAASGTRYVRDRTFSPRVLSAYNHQCSVCEVQLSLLEGAHIIPVHANGPDELWNGIALCRNHHRLFDRRILLIDNEAMVRGNEETLTLLADLGRLGGYERMIGEFRDRRLRVLPDFFNRDDELTERMTSALQTTFAQTPA